LPNATDLQSTEVNESPPREATEPSIAQDSTNITRSTVATGSETLSPPTDHLPSEMSTPTPPATDRRAEMSPAEKLHDADKAMMTINLPETWEGVLGRIKWVMDAVSPVAEVRCNVLLPILDRAEFALSFTRM